MDIGHSYFVRATLNGAVENVARSSSLEKSAPRLETIDSRMKESVIALAPGATITIKRSSYQTFSKAADAAAERVIEPELIANSRCDPGEQFWDANANGVWDDDGGAQGQGGARDVVVITYKVTYPRLFPMAKLLGLPANVELESNTILANQSWEEQALYGPPVATNCSGS
jgi:hypothetical protein